MGEPMAFVAGATGFTGRALVAQLRAQGTRVVAHVRPDSPALNDWRERFEALGAQVDTSPWALEALAERLSALVPTHVFCLVGTTARRAREPTGSAVPESYAAVDYGLTALLAQACGGLEPRPRFVYLSALGTGPRARGGYYRARWQAEEAVRGAGLPHVIVRAPFISGPGRDVPRPLERIGAGAADAALALGRALGMGGLAARFQSMTPEQLAHALIRAAFDPATEGQTLEPQALRGAQDGVTAR